MQELLYTIVAYARGAWRFRTLAMIATWVIGIAAWAMVIALPNVYESSAKVYVDTETVLRPLMKGIAPDTDLRGEVAMMTRVLLSRPQLARVARNTGLYLRADTDLDFDELIDRLRMRVTLQGGRDSLYTIGFEDYDPQMAQRVVQTLLDTFVEDSLGENRTDTADAQTFLENQIEIYDEKLTAAEQRLADFKRENIGLMPGERGDYYTRLQAAMDNLSETRGDLSLAMKRREELLDQLEGEEPTFGLTGIGEDTGPASPMRTQIEEYEAQLNGLLLNYTEKHPSVIALQDKLASLKEAYEEELAKDRFLADSGPTISNPQDLIGLQLDLNPVYQRMKIALSETDLEIVSLRETVRKYEREVSTQRNLMDTIPEVEAQLSRLNRDYQVNKEKHDELLERLARAQLLENMDDQNNDVQFRLIEPPVVPLRPAGPNRPLLIIAAFLGAVGFGLAVAFLFDQIKPVFFTRRTLSEISGLPVLGVVSLNEGTSAVAAGRRSKVLFAIAYGGLFVVLGGAILFMDPTVAFAQDFLREVLA